MKYLFLFSLFLSTHLEASYYNLAETIFKVTEPVNDSIRICRSLYAIYSKKTPTGIRIFGSMKEDRLHKHDTCLEITPKDYLDSGIIFSAHINTSRQGSFGQGSFGIYQISDLTVTSKILSNSIAIKTAEKLLSQEPEPPQRFNTTSAQSPTWQKECIECITKKEYIELSAICAEQFQRGCLKLPASSKLTRTPTS